MLCSIWSRRLLRNLCYNNTILCNKMATAPDAVATENVENLIEGNKRTITEEIDENVPKKQKTEVIDRVKRKKVAMLLSYSGKDYFGMQRNPGMRTIEEDLVQAMLKAKLISDEAFETIQTIQFQRAARTDKGVSAVRQVVSLKLPEQSTREAINEYLPEKIRVFAIKRVTKGFNSKNHCDARTYNYTLPTVTFAPHTLGPLPPLEELDIDKRVEELSIIDGKPLSEYRLSLELLDRVNSVLKIYEGTHNFHNFTSKVKPLDPSANRYMIKISCSKPFVSGDLEFVTLEVKGQSFMLHQIRKMVGLAIAIIRNCTTEDKITEAFAAERMDIPRAPSLGLVLDQVHYDRYNERYGTDGIHEPLDWIGFEEEVEKFRKEHILSHIIGTEHTEKSMLKWLATLDFHTFGAREIHVNS